MPTTDYDYSRIRTVLEHLAASPSAITAGAPPPGEATAKAATSAAGSGGASEAEADEIDRALQKRERVAAIRNARTHSGGAGGAGTPRAAAVSARRSDASSSNHALASAAHGRTSPRTITLEASASNALGHGRFSFK